MEGLGRNWEFGVTKIPEDVPFYENMVEYVLAKKRALYHWDKQPTMEECFYESSATITHNAAPHVLQRALWGDSESRLEIAVRYTTDCGLGTMGHEGSDKALFFLDMITNPENPGYKEGVDRQTMGRAYSCMALVYILRHRELPTLRINRGATRNDLSDNIYQAARYADASARCGYVSSAVLYIGFHLYGLGDRLKIDFSKTARYRSLTALWRVCEHRHAEGQEEERQKQRKLKKAPNAYVCAAPECGIQAVKKAAFAACAGRCPPDLKLHYCSKACQVKDWPAHKPICKAGIQASKAEAMVLHRNGLRLDEPGEALPVEDDDSDFTSPGISIDVPAPDGPGGRMTFTSTMMRPEFMKDIRDEIAKYATGAHR
ncbi:hypothetical protein QCA50_000039 [Cerrena zonata]|uniref:MYND-type domain-containing protein n=1 Tax=Cerrena zonata TaxID=2478898 RepID=A0AAW0GX58_9APHY